MRWRLCCFGKKRRKKEEEKRRKKEKKSAKIQFPQKEKMTMNSTVTQDNEKNKIKRRVKLKERGISFREAEPR
jgi:hypothetical protein